MSKMDKLAARYRVDNGKKFRLKDHDPKDTGSLKSEDEAKDLLAAGLEHLRDRQESLHAQEEWAVLLILQGMDAGGKDSLIKHVMSGVNPTGCEVHSFKQPSQEELRHDFLWRSNVRLPERGRIGIFNRSYYEEVLVVRVHSAVLADEKLPESLASDKKIWHHRYEDISAYERYLARNGTVIRKFFLNLSLEEQKKRFLARLDTPNKNWKFAPSDVEERKFWPEYSDAYEQAIRHTATREAPWYVVPADHKWFTQLVVAAAIVDTLDDLNLSYPRITGQRRKELDGARHALEKEES